MGMTECLWCRVLDILHNIVSKYKDETVDWLGDESGDQPTGNMHENAGYTWINCNTPGTLANRMRTHRW